MATALAVGGAIVGGAISGRGARKAGEAEAEAAREGAALTQAQFQAVQERLDPFIDPGAPALQQQAALAGSLGPEAQAQAFQQFQEDPGTQFLREQGLRLIGSRAAATGGLGGGERLRELTRFSQGLALQDLGARFNRLGAVTGTGLTAAQALGGVSGTASGQVSQALQAGGAGIATGLSGQAQAFGGAISQAGGILSTIPGLPT